MALQSQLFRGDPKLEAAAVSDPAHILPGSAGPHVGKIQSALIILDGAAINQDSIYGPGTAAAVSAFKQKRQILNFQGKIDDIVGKKTIAALDSEMLAKEKGGGAPPPPSRGGARLAVAIPGGLLGQIAPVIINKKFLDIVVRIRGGAFRSALANLDLTAYKAKGNVVLPPFDPFDANKIPEVIKAIAQSTGNRVLLPISVAAVNPSADDAFTLGLATNIDDVLKSVILQPGVICINGNSAGGRNAMKVAAALKGKRTIAFVGLADAALFPDLNGMSDPVVSGANVGRGTADNFPFWSNPPNFDAGIKRNFFQNADNNFTFLNRAFKPVWTGNAIKGDREIHGQISGFSGTAIPPGGGPPAAGGEEIFIGITDRLTNAHNVAGDQGDINNGIVISVVLGSL